MMRILPRAHKKNLLVYGCMDLDENFQLVKVMFWLVSYWGSFAQKCLNLQPQNS